MDYVVRTFAIAGIAIPSFWLGIMIILGMLILTQIWFGNPWMPPVEYRPIWEDPIHKPLPDLLACARDRVPLLGGPSPA